MLVRIYLFRKYDWFNTKDFICSVVIRTIPPVIVAVIVSILMQSILSGVLRFVLCFVVSTVCFVITAYFVSLTKQEKNFVKSLINRIVIKI